MCEAFRALISAPSDGVKGRRAAIFAKFHVHCRRNVVTVAALARSAPVPRKNLMKTKKRRPHEARAHEALTAIVHCKGGAMKHRLEPKKGARAPNHHEGWEDAPPRKRGQEVPDLFHFCGSAITEAGTPCVNPW
jgi:hypothetical protein